MEQEARGWKYFVHCAPVTKVGIDVLRWVIPLEAKTDAEAREEVKKLITENRIRPKGIFFLVKQIVISEYD